MSTWEAVIGLEIHVQLATRSKIFSGASARFGAEPNTQASAVDLGLPGTLPALNAAVLRHAVAFGLGVGASINRRSAFDRKNYFYPDLPKGYQITQMHEPIVLGGAIGIRLADSSAREVRITRAHLEEDAGKSLHEGWQGRTGLDLNRAGTPLLEIVSEPDMRSAEEAVAYARAIHQLVTYLGVSDGDMSQGSLRCDANVSLRRPGAKALGARTETKNVNSFRFLGRAIEHEIARQEAILEGGGEVRRETRLYDPAKDETRAMRTKESDMDYRYFPEPDLLPVVIDDAFIAEVQAALPELPEQKRRRYAKALGLPEAAAALLAASLPMAEYFERALAVFDEPALVSNWMTGDLLAALNREGLEVADSPVSAEALAGLLKRIKDGTLSGKMAKEVFAALWEGKAADADSYIKAAGLQQLSDKGALEAMVAEALKAHPKEAAQYQAGKTKMLGFFVGQVMKASGGKANPQEVNALVKQALGASQPS